jgi:hypothetical protein
VELGRYRTLPDALAMIRPLRHTGEPLAVDVPCRQVDRMADATSVR